MVVELKLDGDGDPVVEVPQEGAATIWDSDAPPQEIEGPAEIPADAPVIYTPDPDHAGGGVR